MICFFAYSASVSTNVMPEAVSHAFMSANAERVGNFSWSLPLPEWRQGLCVLIMAGY